MARGAGELQIEHPTPKSARRAVRIAILTYHHICDPPPGALDKPSLYVNPRRFNEQLDWLARSGMACMTLDQVQEVLEGRGSEPPRGGFVLTFDDGYADNYANALPEMIRRGFTGAFFITTGRLGTRDAFGQPFMTEDQVRELAAAGMTVGSHAKTHPKLGRIGADEARTELDESKRELERITGARVDWLCYPSGSFNEGVVRAARELGYVGACSVIRDNRPRADQLFWLPRVMIMRDTPIRRFPYLFSSLYHWVHARKNRRRWGDLA